MPPIPEPQGIEHATEDEAGHGHFHRRHAGLFVGGTSRKEENGVTLGGDFEYRFYRFLGAGLQAEHAFADLKDTVVDFPVFFHPGAGLKLATGPGFEHKSEPESSVGEGFSAGEQSGTHFLWRIQVLYDFSVKEGVSLTPSLALDFVEGRQFWVYGLTLGYGF